MKVAGFTIVKNAEKYNYQVWESISSVLPLVDYFLVVIGDSEDTTEEIVKSIKSNKIEIQHSVWDMSLKNGHFLSAETNKAFDRIADDYDWCIYVQADEVLHEDDYPEIRESMLKYKDNKEVQGLIFNWKHFWGNYKYISEGRCFYRRDIRIIKNNKNIRSWNDAQGFRIKDGSKLTGVPLKASIYHYGWVRHPKYMRTKVQNSLWNRSMWKDTEEEMFNYNEEYTGVKLYKGTHPKLMQERIAKHNWEVNINPKKRKYKLKERFLMWLERNTGHRLFENQHFHVYGKGRRLSNFWDEALF